MKMVYLGAGALIERRSRHGEQILHFLIRSMNQHIGNESSSTSMDMLDKCRSILKDIFENNLWENIPLRLVVIERNLEVDGTDEKITLASSALQTFTELVKVGGVNFSHIFVSKILYETLG